MIEKGTKISLDNDYLYVAYDVVNINNKNYLYLVPENDEFIPQIVENRDGVIKEIKDKNEYNLVLKQLILQNKDDLIDYMKEINEN